MAENTTIQVSGKVRDQLFDMGSKGESFNDIITGLLKAYQKEERRKKSQKRA